MTKHFHQRGSHAFPLPLLLYISSSNHQQRGTAPHLSILMVNKDIPGAVVLQIGYLQAMGSADFSWLECGIHRIDLHYRLGLSGLQKRKTFLET